jgi:hypothetical protein
MKNQLEKIKMLCLDGLPGLKSPLGDADMEREEILEYNQISNTHLKWSGVN